MSASFTWVGRRGIVLPPDLSAARSPLAVGAAASLRFPPFEFLINEISHRGVRVNEIIRKLPGSRQYKFMASASAADRYRQFQS